MKESRLTKEMAGKFQEEHYFVKLSSQEKNLLSHSHRSKILIQIFIFDTPSPIKWGS